MPTRSNSLIEGKIFICGEYDLASGTVGELSIVMMRQTELARNYNGGDVIPIDGVEFILWGRKLDAKEQVVSYQLAVKS